MRVDRIISNTAWELGPLLPSIFLDFSALFFRFMQIPYYDPSLHISLIGVFISNNLQLGLGIEDPTGPLFTLLLGISSSGLWHSAKNHAVPFLPVNSVGIDPPLSATPFQILCLCPQGKQPW